VCSTIVLAAALNEMSVTDPSNWSVALSSFNSAARTVGYTLPINGDRATTLPHYVDMGAGEMRGTRCEMSKMQGDRMRF